MAETGVFQNVFRGGDHAEVTDVRDGTTYGNGAFTGTLDVGGGTVPNYPTEAQVLLGVSFGTSGAEEFTGNYRPVAVANVRDGIAFGSLDSESGILDLPSINDVRLNVLFDNSTKTGNVRVPPANKVEDGYFYDTNDTVEGTLEVAVCDYPSVNDVRLGIIFGGGTGTVRVPPAGKVEDGYAYDANDSVIGTLDPGSGATDYPLEVNVRAGISYNFGAQVGVYEPAPEADVRLGVSYGANGTEYVGLWAGGDAGAGLAGRGWLG